MLDIENTQIIGDVRTPGSVWGSVAPLDNSWPGLFRLQHRMQDRREPLRPHHSNFNMLVRWCGKSPILALPRICPPTNMPSHECDVHNSQTRFECHGRATTKGQSARSFVHSGGEARRAWIRLPEYPRCLRCNWWINILRDRNRSKHCQTLVHAKRPDQFGDVAYCERIVRSESTRKALSVKMKQVEKSIQTV
jgi:hypothetical protein